MTDKQNKKIQHRLFVSLNNRFGRISNRTSVLDRTDTADSI